ncbi:MAG: RtcB family protein [Planctomycetota bacterium]
MSQSKLDVIHHPKCPPSDDERRALDEIASLPQVKRAVALPDLHWKKGLEAPSSAAYAVRGHIVPQLSSCALNCGMGLIDTGLQASAVTPAKLDELYLAFRDSRRQSRFDIEPGTLRRIVISGAPAIVERYQLDEKTALRGMEDRGVVTPKDAEPTEVWDSLDPDILEDPSYDGLKNLGLGFDGNHFLEAQVLDSVLDEEESARHGIAKGRLYVMYHGGGGVVPGFVGGYYGNRGKGYVRSLRFWASKMKFHFRRPRDWKRFREKWRYYFSGAPYPAIPVEGPEGRRNRVALAASMNYGYAYRVAMLARIRWAVEKVFGKDRGADVGLAWDTSHNTIAPEVIEGEEVYVHRHNAIRVKAGDLAILPGHNTTPTYVGVGLEGTARTLDSMPHGAGDTIKLFREMKEGGDAPPLATRRYEGENPAPRVVAHGGAAGLDAVVKLLEDHRIWRPIARLRPVGVLKDYHY